MTDAFIDQFLASFDDSHYPTDFMERYELMECLSHNEMGETLLVKDRHTNEYYVAKCYTNKSGWERCIRPDRGVRMGRGSIQEIPCSQKLLCRDNPGNHGRVGAGVCWD